MIHLVPSNSIVVDEERVRKTFQKDKHEELVTSILENGLIHPLVCTSRDQTLVLVSGERRLRALRAIETDFSFSGKVIQKGLVPILLNEELSEDEALAIELAENVDRHDIEWQDRVTATARLHQLRQKQNPSQTLTETALEAFGKPNINVVRDRVLLAKQLDNPNISSAPSEKEALKRLKKNLEEEFNSALALEVLKDDPPKDSSFQIFQGNMIEVIEAHKEWEGKVDCIVTDPPYGIGAHNFSHKTETVHSYDDSLEAFLRNMPFWVKAISQVSKAQSHLYWFLDHRQFSAVKNVLQNFEWEVYFRPLIWYKGEGGQAGNAALWPIRTYECILYAVRGKRPTLGKLKGDVISIPMDRGEMKLHAAQKPTELYRELLSRSVAPGDLVMDPFCGSGTVFEAARLTMTKAIGIDLETEVASRRLGKML